MQMTIVEYSNDIVEVREKEITVFIADFDTGVGAIPNSVVDAKGDLVVGTAADTVDRLGVGTDGQVLTADSAVAKGVKWANTASVAASAERRSLTMTGDVVLTNTDVKYQFLDPGGAGRTITLPAEGTSNHPFVIMNTADAAEILTVNNDAGTLIGYVEPGLTKSFLSDETNWFMETNDAIQIAYATSDLESTSDTTVTDVPGMSLTLAVGTYKIDAYLLVNSTANGGTKISFGGTAAETGMRTIVSFISATGQTSQSLVNLATSKEEKAAHVAVRITGVMIITTAGTLTMQAAQQTSHADTSTVYIGSWMELKRMA